MNVTTENYSFYDDLLDAAGKANPDLRKLLEEKYEEDRKNFTAAAEEFSPSKEPKYWAKKSCSKCYGRGIIGTRYNFVGQPARKIVYEETGKTTYANGYKQPVNCRCAQKSYGKWLKSFREFYNALKEETKKCEEGLENGQ